jgi:lysophospholipase L1-like esterase
MSNSLLRLAAILPFVLTLAGAQNLEPIAPIPASVTFAPAKASLPTLFIVGDSTCVGWGPQAVQFYNTSKINVVVGAANGRSARTLITEGLWDRIRVHIKPNDIVLIEFGHHDSSPIIDSNRSRGVIESVGNETQDVDNPVTHKHETVLSFGGYMRQLIHDVQDKGATPIILSQTPRNEWVKGHIVPDHHGFAKFAAAIAADQHLQFLDVNLLIAAEFERLGEARAQEIYQDSVHVKPQHWILYATWITEGLKGLPNAPLAPYFSSTGGALPAIHLP